MFTNPNSRALARQIAIACVVGALLSLPAFAMCFDLAGAGHGSNVAFYVFFGPTWVVWMLPPHKSGATFAGLWFLTVGMLGLYGIYGGVIAYARSKRVGLWALLAIVCFHYVAVVWAVTGFGVAGQFFQLARVSAQVSIMHSVITVDLLVALHLLAFQYARSTPPFRPRMTWPVAAMLAIGLLAGVTLYAWGVAMG